MAVGSPLALPDHSTRPRSRGLSSRLLFVALLVATAGIMSLLYTWKLDQAQPYLNQDEAGFGLNVYLLSTTRHDYFGNQLPIYIGYLDNHQLGGAFQAYWAIPFVRALGLSVFSIRLSVALIGLLALVLFAFLAWRLSRSSWISLLGIWVLGTTPLFFMLSRVFLDGVVTVPFVIAWLICVVELRQRPRSMLLLSSVILGLGFYSYGTARMIMPVYMALTLVLALVSRMCSWRTVVAAAVAFIVMLVPGLVVAAQDPTLYTARFRELTWLADDPSVPSAVAIYLGHYLANFDPADLFVRGDQSLIHSTGKAGVFLWATLPLAVIGGVSFVWSSVTKREPFSLLIPLAFLLFPLPLALIAEQHSPSRGVYAVAIYGALCVVGVSVIARLSRWVKLGRYVLALVLLVGAVEAGAFFTDYFGPYAARSTAQLEFNGNKEGAFRALMSEATGDVYYDVENAATTTYARFFKAELGFQGNVNPAPPEWADRLPLGARLLTARPDRYGSAFRVVDEIPEFGSSQPRYVILRRFALP